MNYSKIVKQEVCTEICENNQSTSYIANLYGIPLKTVENWITAYNKNPNCFTEKTYRLKSGVKRTSSKSYEDMTKEELRIELMRADIELARLKKGYTVRKSGGKLEYGFFSD